MYTFREVISKFEGLLVDLIGLAQKMQQREYPLLDQTLQTSICGTAFLRTEEQHTDLLPRRVAHVDRCQSGPVKMQCGHTTLQIMTC